MQGVAALCLAALSLAACASSTAPPPKSGVAASARPAPDARAIIDGAVAELFEEAPRLPRLQLARHEYDGKLADYSAAGFAALERRLRARRERLRAVDTGALSPNDALDVGILRLMTESELFRLEVLDAPHKRPDYYGEIFDVASYANDAEATLAERLERVVAHEEAALVQAPHLLENLRPPLSRVIARWQAQSFEGMVVYLRDELPRALADAHDAAMQARFRRANDAFTAEVDRIARALRGFEASGDDSHVLGKEGYRRFLAAVEGITMPLDEFERLGEEDLEKNERAWAALVKTVTPLKPAPDEVVPLSVRFVDEARAFVIAHHIVTLPPGAREVPVKPSPAYFRWNGAQLAGTGKSPVYLITLPDPSLPAETRREAVLPVGVWLVNAVHEVYPGHYVQALFADGAPTVVQRLAFDETFNEGWAHYTEQMMVDEGLGAGDPQVRLGQLSEALRRNCRYLASVGLHVHGMTLAQAEDMFVERCHQDRATAKQNATRGAFDPGYFSYTLGKIELLRLREQARRQLGPRFSLERFHDAVLSHGRPAIPLLGPVVLRELAAQ